MKSPTAIVALLVFAAAAAAGAASSSFQDPSAELACAIAQPCDNLTCVSPDCGCSFNEPAIEDVKQRPQIVYLTFDDAMTPQAEEQFYRGLFNGTYKNPNGCAITATHFLAHYANDYSLVHRYWQMGHEMAAHSVTHRSNTTYWVNLNATEWSLEVGDMKRMTAKYAKIPEEEIVGVRAAFLQGGADNQFAMMEMDNFLYDASMPSLQFGFSNLENGRWPYSLDYKSDMDCQIEPCPKCSWPGIWVQPMLDLEDSRTGGPGPNSGYPCDMLDSCIIPQGNSPNDVEDLMMKNFNMAYEGNTRAPIGFYAHAAWFFGQEWHYRGYKQFLDKILQHDDVWVVPVKAGIAYRKNPVTNQEIIDGALEDFQCADQPPTFTCVGKAQTNCKYENVETEDFTQSEVYMRVCGGQCPAVYPWLGNWEGLPQY